jgi:hypothetical protein
MTHVELIERVKVIMNCVNEMFGNSRHSKKLS